MFSRHFRSLENDVSCQSNLANMETQPFSRTLMILELYHCNTTVIEALQGNCQVLKSRSITLTFSLLLLEMYVTTLLLRSDHQ